MSQPPAHQRLSDEPLDLGTLIAASEGPGFGAMVVFTGTVRADNQGKTVTGLTYSAYRPLAESSLADIEDRAVAEHPGTRVLTQHRLGDLVVGDTSVAVVARAGHRAEAFAAARWAIEALKKEVPVFKLEHYADGSQAYLDGCSLNQDSTS
ncbi:MAG: molybdenum cofactor biosynthesis protein MoaE [Salinisphaeraceae bacterium]